MRISQKYLQENILIFLITCMLTGTVWAQSSQDILTAHNATRSKRGIPDLEWSEEIAEFAQEWADYLAENNDCRMEHRNYEGKDGITYGENLYWASSIQWTNGKKEIQIINGFDVVSSWTEEEKNYNPETSTCLPGKSCGHFTQVVWKDTKKIGCGMLVCPDKSQIWVCNYYPPGNRKGEKPY